MTTNRWAARTLERSTARQQHGGMENGLTPAQIIIAVTLGVFLWFGVPNLMSAAHMAGWW